jgi:hypothetical protein
MLHSRTNLASREQQERKTITVCNHGLLIENLHQCWMGNHPPPQPERAQPSLHQAPCSKLLKTSRSNNNLADAQRGCYALTSTVWSSKECCRAMGKAGNSLFGSSTNFEGNIQNKHVISPASPKSFMKLPLFPLTN